MNWDPPVFTNESVKTDFMIDYLNANGWAAPGLAFISVRSHRLRVTVHNADPPLVLTCASDIGLVPLHLQRISEPELVATALIEVKLNM
ncbi:hypothetical protein BCR37DRAFT_381044 [Protomyces lactucae-debilis]|uniref:Uncharacterized protein n=1 Tax=Protomyces lactucae-debilis TaxID=2754530 RepID=A0A1Y2F8Z5_PROLT|nr:uncharacterized protein BCR37DRAFT_381044 [Protomyces lactucae-debilis]ORY80380.1 hypothetical protein BCR37DRAFT_381044 [Protomyces lactucae-debilis]